MLNGAEILWNRMVFNRKNNSGVKFVLRNFKVQNLPIQNFRKWNCWFGRQSRSHINGSTNFETQSKVKYYYKFYCSQTKKYKKIKWNQAKYKPNEISTLSKLEMAKLEIVTFGIESAMMPQFIDSYNAAINKSKIFSMLEKFNCLRSFWYGEAQSLTSDFTLTNDNYD